MKHIAFATSLICGLLGYHEANGQGFWYLPDGGDYSYRYGWDLGDGFGYGVGYGFGYGLTGTPQAAAAGAYADLMGFQSQYDVTQLPKMYNGFHNGSEVWPNVRKQKSSTELKKQQALKLEHVKRERESRARYLEQQASQPRTIPLRGLSGSEFDNSTGQIQWPTALLRDSFAAERAEIELLLKGRVRVGTTDELDASLVRKTQGLDQEFRQQIRKIPAKEYLEGRNFLHRLVFEAQLPVG